MNHWPKWILLCLIFALSFSCASNQRQKRLAASWTELGNSWAELGKNDKAEKAWQNAVEMDPGQGVAVFNLARLMAENGNYEESGRLGRMLLKREPDNSMVLTVLAYSLHKAGHDDEAIETYRKVVELNKADADSLLNLAILYEGRQLWFQAGETYRSVLAIREDSVASIRLAICLKELGEYDEALTITEKWLDKNSNVPAAAMMLMELYELTGETDKMLALAEKTAEKAGNNTETLFFTASLLLKHGKEANTGLSVLGRILDTGYSDRSRLEELAEISRPEFRDEIRQKIEISLSHQAQE